MSACGHAKIDLCNAAVSCVTSKRGSSLRCGISRQSRGAFPKLRRIARAANRSAKKIQIIIQHMDSPSPLEGAENFGDFLLLAAASILPMLTDATTPLKKSETYLCEIIIFFPGTYGMHGNG